MRTFPDNMEGILQLKRELQIPFIHTVHIPGMDMCTAEEQPCIFKMTTAGRGSGVDYVRECQPGGSLESSWVVLDHTFRLFDNWVTLGLHLYDVRYIRNCQLVLLD